MSIKIHVLCFCMAIGCAPDVLGQLQPKPGWPNVVSAPTVRWGPVTIADVDGDGNADVLVAARGESATRELHVFDYLGQSLPGWPVILSLPLPEHPLAVGDVDGDGDQEVVHLTRTYEQITVYSEAGVVQPGWPINIGVQELALADIDGDDVLDIVVVTKPVTIGWQNKAVTITVLDGFGQAKAGWPILQSLQPWMDTTSLPSDGVNLLQIAAGDLDYDGKAEIVVPFGVHGFMGPSRPGPTFVYQHDGTVRPGWPFVPQFGGTFFRPRIVDLNGDGTCEILGYYNGTRSLTASGTLLNYYSHGNSSSPLGVGDLDRDGTMEVVSGGSPIGVAEHYGWDSISAPTQAEATSGFSIGDYDRDGVLELFCIAVSNGVAALHAYSGEDLSIEPGFPMSLPSLPQATDGVAIHVHDLDQNGQAEVFVASPTHLYLWEYLGGTAVTQLCEWGLSRLNGPGLSASYNEGRTPARPGDVTGDGALNLSDVVVLVHWLLGGDTANVSCASAADTNGDRKHNLQDLVLAIQDLFVATSAVPDSCRIWPSDHDCELSACP